MGGRKETVTSQDLAEDIWNAYLQQEPDNKGKNLFKEIVSSLATILHPFLDHEFSWETLVQCHNLVLNSLYFTRVIDVLISNGIYFKMDEFLSWMNTYGQLAQTTPEESWRIYAEAGAYKYTSQMEYFRFFGFGLSNSHLQRLELKLNGDENVSLPTVRDVLRTTPKIFIPFELKLEK